MSAPEPTDCGSLWIVDDDADAFALLRHAFARVGARERIEWHNDGEHALAALRQLVGAGESLPVLLILDLNMPGLHGFEVLRAIRADARLSDLLVVVMSSSTRPEDRRLALELGAFCYFEKFPRRTELVPLLATARGRTAPLPAIGALPRRRALRRILTLVDDAEGACDATTPGEMERDVQRLFASVRRRASIQLLSDLKSAEEWPFEPGVS